MTQFLIATAILLLASLALLTRPWWRRGRSDTGSRRALNTTIYRDQLVELERDRNVGQLSDADYQEASGELQRRLLEDAAEADQPLIASPKRWRSLLPILVVFPLLAGGLYAWLGSPAALDQMARRDFTQSDIEKMVAGLATKLEKEPNNVKGWIMLARSYKAMRRFDDAERAFERLTALAPQDPQLLADYADLLATKAGGNLSGRPEQLINKALQLDPDNLQTLWLGGTAAFNRNDFGTAAQHWQRALRQLPPDSDDAKMLSNILAEAQQKAGGGQPVMASKNAPPPTTVSAAAIRGHVEIAGSLKALTSPDDIVFILARADGGSPMPLAAKRLKVADLPLDFTLDDSDALSPQNKISGAKAIKVEARVAKGGDAKSRPGDLVGSVGPVKPGAKGLTIKIDNVVQ